MKDAKRIIYLVDVANYDQLVASSCELRLLLEYENASYKPILVVFNKTDSVCGFEQELIDEIFDLESLDAPSLTWEYCSALTGSGCKEVLNWLECEEGNMVPVKREGCCYKKN